MFNRTFRYRKSFSFGFSIVLPLSVTRGRLGLLALIKYITSVFFLLKEILSCTLSAFTLVSSLAVTRVISFREYLTFRLITSSAYSYLRLPGSWSTSLR